MQLEENILSFYNKTSEGRNYTVFKLNQLSLKLLTKVTLQLNYNFLTVISAILGTFKRAKT